jgi:hypothetical protein
MRLAARLPALIKCFSLRNTVIPVRTVGSDFDRIVIQGLELAPFKALSHDAER